LKIKKWLLITMLLMFIFTLSACSSKKAVVEPFEIHIQLANQNSVFTIPYEDAAVDFQKLNPQITVTIDYNEANNYSPNNSVTLLESDAPPDIVPFFGANREVVKKGLFWDLLKLHGSKGMDINQQILDSNMNDGKLLYLPGWAYTNVILYNKVLFDEAHIPYPQGDWTWEQFRDISKQFKSSNGSRLAYDMNTFEMLMVSNGKGLISPDGDTSVGYLDSPEAIHTLQWLNAYYHDDKEKTVPLDYDEAVGDFSHAKTAMIIGGMGMLFDIFSGSNSDKLGVAPMPHFKGGERASLIGYTGYGISGKSKHPEAALAFLKYLALTINDESVQLNAYSLSTSKAVGEAIGQNKDPVKSIYADEMNYAVKGAGANNPFFYEANMAEDFKKFLTVDDQDIPGMLHKFALKMDQELNRLRDEAVQTEN
jgi:multiple sugar transport system substrate-binding protein